MRSWNRGRLRLLLWTGMIGSALLLEPLTNGQGRSATTLAGTLAPWFPVAMIGTTSTPAKVEAADDASDMSPFAVDTPLGFPGGFLDVWMNDDLEFAAVGDEDFEDDDAVDETLTVAEQEQATKLMSPKRANSAEQSRYVKIRKICRVTAYCDRGVTASGRWSGVGQCAAPGYVPLGAQVSIPSLGKTLVATDRTHRRFRHNTVDIFMPTEEACIRFGRRYLEVEFTVDRKAATGSRLARGK